MNVAAAVWLFLFLLLSAVPARSACRELDVARSWTRSAYAAQPDATIEFFGHNFFQITSTKGTKIITDPVSPGFYPTPDVAPHAITVGREHPNHNYVEIAKNKPVILRGLANYGAEWNKVSTTVGDVLIYSVPIYQQQFGNALKGAAFVFDLGTLCIAHLGDLSHKLTEDQIKAFGKVDIAMIPIGGTFHHAAGHGAGSLAAAKTEDRHPDALSGEHLSSRHVRERLPAQISRQAQHDFQQDGLASADANCRVYPLGYAGLQVKKDWSNGVLE